MIRKSRAGALLLLVLAMFHCIVLVPRADATVTAVDFAAKKILYNISAPSAVHAARLAGQAALVGWRLAGVAGILYLLYDSGALGKLDDWWDAGPGSLPDEADYPISTTRYYAPPNGNVGRSVEVFGGCISPPGGISARFFYENGYMGYQGCYANKVGQMIAEINTWLGVTAPSRPTVPTDYSTNADAKNISAGLTVGELKGTPGSGPAMNAAGPGQPIPVSINYLSPEAASELVNALGLTDIDPTTGAQANPPVDDNVSIDTSSINSRLEQIIGIERQIEANTRSSSSQAVDISPIENKLTDTNLEIDNLTTISQLEKQTLDNIAVGVDALGDAITQTTSTENSLSNRIAELRDLAATKFPFSIGAALTMVPPAGGTANLGTLSLPGMDIPILPFTNPLGSTFEWMRTLIQALFWAGTLFLIIGKVSNL